MNAYIFHDVLRHMDDEVGSNHYQGKRCLLLIYNAPFHIRLPEDLKHLTVAMLPPKTTAKLQPMDQGIITCLKQQPAEHRQSSTKSYGTNKQATQTFAHGTK